MGRNDEQGPGVVSRRRAGGKGFVIRWRRCPDSSALELTASIDQLFGHAPKRTLAKQEGDSRLRRRLLAIEKLDVAEKRQVLQLLDALIEREQLKRKMERRA